MRELALDKLPKRVLSSLDLETAFKASRCVLAAERLLVFRELCGKELSAAEIGKRTGIKPRYCRAFLDYLVFLGLLKKRGDLYRNSVLANDHFIKSRSVDWTGLWSYECTEDYKALTVMEEVITGDKDWRQILGKPRKPDYELVQEDRQWAKSFTYALYDLNRPVAKMLPAHLDLSGYRSLLDVGGGSGVMSFELVRAYPQLRASILDFPYVCDAAVEIIRKEGLSHRVKTIPGDMNESIPFGFDVIMFWNIGHVEDRVVWMAYKSLPEGGMAVRDCTPPSHSQTLSPSAFLHEYLAVRPKQQSKARMMASLKEAGFESVRYRRIDRGLGLITALKGKGRK